ncbi:MAG: flippase-like domain-containing protein [Gemmatimonadetes bacterium]|nr:flippase-like domain-containing protein [Gemmatimonadota bacterium]
MRRVIRHALQAVLLGFVGWYLYVHWSDYERVFQVARPQWWALLLSCVLVLVAYVVLIQTWRQVVEAWGERLDFAGAARIWFVSNLGKYVPGKVWAIAAMGALAQERGVSPAAAVGSSLVVQLVNLITGFAVFFIAGARAVEVPAAAIGGVVLLALATIAAPSLLPWCVRGINRLAGREFAVPHLPTRAIYWAAGGTTLAWALYGVAFEFFAIGVSGGAVGGSLGDWTAVFVGPYLLGFIAVFAPGGIGVREVAMAEALQRSGLAIGATSALLVAASRVWLTLLEIVPGVVLLLMRPPARSSSTSSHR